MANGTRNDSAHVSSRATTIRSLRVEHFVSKRCGRRPSVSVGIRPGDSTYRDGDALLTGSSSFKSRTERSPVEGGGRVKRGQEGPLEGDARAAPGQSRGRAAPLGTRRPKRPRHAAGRRGVGVQVPARAWGSTPRALGWPEALEPTEQASRAIPGAPQWRAPHRGPSGMPAPVAGLRTLGTRRHLLRTSCGATRPSPASVRADASRICPQLPPLQRVPPPRPRPPLRGPEISAVSPLGRRRHGSASNLSWAGVPDWPPAGAAPVL